LLKVSETVIKSLNTTYLETYKLVLLNYVHTCTSQSPFIRKKTTAADILTNYLSTLVSLSTVAPLG